MIIIIFLFWKKTFYELLLSCSFYNLALAKWSDHVYLRHLSTEYRSILSADMSTDSRPICRPSIDRYVGRHIGRVSVDMLFELIDRRSTLSVGMSVDTRPTSRPICRWCTGRLSVVYRSTVGGVSVDCRWYRSIVNRCFVEIAAVSLPTGDAKEDSIPYARVLIERRCSSNCRLFEYISNAT